MRCNLILCQGRYVDGYPSSKCFGDPIVGVKTWLRDNGFEELFQLYDIGSPHLYHADQRRPFNGASDIRVHLYLRDDDHRVRIVCKSPHTSRPSEYYCLPLDMLEIVRNGPCLQICRRRDSGRQLVLWANLKFSTIERMYQILERLLSPECADVIQEWCSFSAHSLHFGRRIVATR